MSRVELHDMRLTAENAAALVARYDIVVDGSDNFETRYAVADACEAEKRPLVHAAVGRFDGSVTVLIAVRRPAPTASRTRAIATSFPKRRRTGWCRPAPRPASSAR